MNYRFQYYSNSINCSEALGYVDLNSFLNSTKNPKPLTLELFNNIAICEVNGDMLTKAKLKESLYSFTPCVNVQNFRRYRDILRFTGLAVLDFDHITNSEDFKNYLFENYDFIIASWLSPSKKGVKALVKIPVSKSVDEFKSYFYGLGEEMWQFNGFDGSGQNCVLPLFQSYDSKLLMRTDANVFNKKGYCSTEYIATNITPKPVKFETKYEVIIQKIIDTGFAKITTNGHPQLRALCVSIGGYVANNYIYFNDAINYINNKITNHNYLKKGVNGYQKTAKQAVKLGMNSPLNLSIDGN